MNRDVVVSGIGIVSPYGVGLDCFWSAISSGVSAITKWQPPGVTDFPVSYAATIELTALASVFPKYFMKEHFSKNSLERRFIFGIIAAELALKDADAQPGDLSRLGISVCSGIPEIDDKTLVNLAAINSDNALEQLVAKRNSLVNDYSGIRCSNDVLATELARKYNCTGPVFNINGACAGASQAIGVAYKSIQRGEADAVLVGGGDSVMNIRTLSALVSLGAASTSKRFGDALCRPFDENRSGLVPGEGAAILLLEEKESVARRGGKTYCRMLGYGSSLDAWKVTAPHPKGRGAVASMSRAIDDANISYDDIGYINAHGTSTQLNDVVESEAIEAVFKSHCDNSLLVSSTKSMIGHWIASSGAPEAVAAIMALKHQCVPPTINLKQADERCRLDYVTGKKRETSLNYVLSNSFGFGGINASLIFGRV